MANEHQAFLLLRFGFTVAPIIAGLDKFLHLLTDWEKYLAPFVPNTLGIQPHTFMMIVGVVEIVAGLVVAFAPRWGGYLVALWLLGIIVNLIAVGGYLDVALRDLGLLLGAVAMSRLAEDEARVGIASPQLRAGSAS
ncbi:MAG TPA: hypothetical protein VKE50_09925 [Thermoanaerobaculia bacterium]|nr:hypothetical protein [Thermoanaerobaculia bacterium]